MTSGNDITRRSFVTGASLLAASLAAGTALGGCSGDKPSTKATDLQTKLDAGEDGARLFTDGIDRAVAIPSEITKVAATGPYAQIMLLQLAPERLVGLSSQLSDTQAPYFPDYVSELPVLGKLYGGKNANMNYEEIIGADPDVIIDVGERKSSLAEDLDKLQTNTGLPVVFIECGFDTMIDAYRKMGDVLGADDHVAELVSWVSDVISLAEKHCKAIKADGLRVIYSTGEYGLNVMRADSTHSAVLDAVGVNNIADVESASQAEVSIEQMLNWDPDVLLLAPNSYYGDIYSDPVWAEAKCVKNKRVYEVPAEPYSWIDQPPSVQQALGVLWLGNLLYPKLYDFDIVEKAREYYQLFWNYDVSEDKVRELLANSTFA